MNEDRKNELEWAYDTLVRHNLWRRGRTYTMPSNTNRELGESIDIACGAILDLMQELEDAEIYRQRRKILLEQATCAERESVRLRAILAAHHIKYKK